MIIITRHSCRSPHRNFFFTLFWSCWRFVCLPPLVRLSVSSLCLYCRRDPQAGHRTDRFFLFVALCFQPLLVCPPPVWRSREALTLVLQLYISRDWSYQQTTAIMSTGLSLNFSFFGFSDMVGVFFSRLSSIRLPSFCLWCCPQLTCGPKTAFFIFWLYVSNLLMSSCLPYGLLAFLWRTF